MTRFPHVIGYFAHNTSHPGSLSFPTRLLSKAIPRSLAVASPIEIVFGAPLYFGLSRMAAFGCYWGAFRYAQTQLEHRKHTPPPPLDTPQPSPSSLTSFNSTFSQVCDIAATNPFTQTVGGVVAAAVPTAVLAVPLNMHRVRIPWVALAAATGLDLLFRS